MHDHFYMRRVLRLAKKGIGYVSPNPLVGAVIVKNNVIVGEGYHKKYGGDHAEIAALKAAGNNARNAALYCNLEPCAHWEKTPPCTDAIVRSGIQKVIIGIPDPNSKVNGNGILYLREKGIDVETGILEYECRSINAPYSKYIQKGLPFVAVKMAQSLDGKITREMNSRSQISSEKAQRFVHRLRAEYDAVMIGKRTARIDNPLLTPRLVKGRIPARIILDTHLECEPSLSILNTVNLGKVYIATASQNSQKIQQFKEKGVSILQVAKNAEGAIQLSEVLAHLGTLKVTSVLVEGGAEVFSSFLRDRLVDRVILLIAPYLFGEGVNVLEKNGSIVELKNVSRKQLGHDFMVMGTPVYS